MAIYYLHMKTFGRSAGHRATSAAAYRAGERIRDERSGRVYNHVGREDVLHREILLPAELERAGAAMDWARDRARLWNAAEHAESRINARVAREYMVALPVELVPEQRLGLARTFAQELADRYRFAVDLAIHAPRNDPRNYHAHLLATTREVGPNGMGAKTWLDVSGPERQRRALPPTAEELKRVRERWATLTNGALRSANIDARVSHLSYAAQGSSRVPGRHLGRPADLGAPAAGSEPSGTTDALSALERLQEQARNNWLELRRRAAAPSPVAASARTRDSEAHLAEAALSPGHRDFSAGD